MSLPALPISESLSQSGLLLLCPSMTWNALVLGCRPDLPFSVASLACTPLREIFDWPWAVGLRRMLGLFAFSYALLHFATYALLDQRLNGSAILADVTKRPFIIAGFAAFVILVPLAATSTAGAVRRLGFRRWKRLQRLAYVAGILAVIHFVLRVKADVGDWVMYRASDGFEMFFVDNNGRDGTPCRLIEDVLIMAKIDDPSLVW